MYLSISYFQRALLKSEPEYNFDPLAYWFHPKLESSQIDKQVKQMVQLEIGFSFQDYFVV